MGILGPAGTAGAGGVSLFEQGTPRNGVATAGSAAFADDASTAFFNPAGMSFLSRSQLMSGNQIVRGVTRFDPDDDVTDVFMGGNSGSDAAGWAPGASLHYAHVLGERWRAGISLTTPVAGSLDYDNNWVGRYYVTETTLLAFNLNPAVSFRVNDQLSIGAGVNVGYANLDFKLRIPNVASLVVPTLVRRRIEEAAESARLPPVQDFLNGLASRVPDPMPMPDGKLELDKLDDFAVGANVGIIWSPRPDTRIGLAWRSEISFDLDGDFETRGIGPVLTALGLDEGDAESDFDIPQIATLSLWHQPTERLTVLVDVMWTDWSTFDYTPLRLGTSAGAAINIPRDWKDTWRFALGLEFALTPRWTLQLGGSHDTSPIRDGNKGLPDLPITQIWKIATGVKYVHSENTTLSLNYLYATLGRSPVDFAAIGGRLSGDYSRNELHMLSFSINWQHGD